MTKQAISLGFIPRMRVVYTSIVYRGQVYVPFVNRLLAIVCIVLVLTFHSSTRLANAYGPRNLSGPLPTFYARLTQDKSVFVMDTRRDFIFVDDLVDCVLKSFDAGEHRGGEPHVEKITENVLRRLGSVAIEDARAER